MQPPADSPPPSSPPLGYPPPGYPPPGDQVRRRPRRERGRGGGIVLTIVALLIGSIMGATCVTCATLQSDYDYPGFFATGDRVGVVEVAGPIMSSREVVEAIRRFKKRDEIVAIVLRVESPGGGVAPSQAIYTALRDASEVKPVVASMGSVAASGGYWISLGTDWIFAEAGTITGSIGVIFQTADLQGVAEALRFRIRTYKSGPLKDMGSPYRDPTPADEAQFMALIEDIYDQFVTLTAERRGQPVDQVRTVADGRVMTGRAAFKADLVDELGGLYVAAKKAVLLARAREDDQVQTSSAAYADVEDPILVYPPEPRPSLADLVGAAAGQAIREGIAEGVRSGLRTPAESSVELR